MPPDSRKWLWDAAEAAQTILRFSAGKTFTDFRNDDLLRAAIERHFIILGEALGKLRQTDPSTAGRLPDLARAVAMRNLLVHVYAEVDEAIVWGVVTGSLPALLGALQAI
jgi:uncharacterized protein with HEPN domain